MVSHILSRLKWLIYAFPLCNELKIYKQNTQEYVHVLHRIGKEIDENESGAECQLHLLTHYQEVNKIFDDK